MAAPTQPTAALIVAEAFAQVGISSPTSAQTTRATDYGIEKVKRDIWLMGKRWRILRTTQYMGLKVGVSRYANPSDHEQDIQEPGMNLLDGNSRGTLQAAAAGTATLAAAEPIQQAQAEGRLLLLTSGANANQAEQIDDYDATTKIATMRASWGTTPAGTEDYLVVEEHIQLSKRPWQDRNRILRPGDTGQPSQVFEMGTGPGGYIEFDRVPDRIYGLKRDYYANLLLVDLSSTLYTYILRNWAGIFTQGLIEWIQAGYDDTRRPIEGGIYGTMLKRLAGMEKDLQNESNLQQRCTD